MEALLMISPRAKRSNTESQLMEMRQKIKKALTRAVAALRGLSDRRAQTAERRRRGAGLPVTRRYPPILPRERKVTWGGALKGEEAEMINALIRAAWQGKKETQLIGL